MERLYFATALSLILHQIDAAFWHEWEMFMVPGGIQGFLAFNLVAIAALLLGYRSVVRGDRPARRWAQCCGALGVLTFLLHGGFALGGHRQFDLPFSLLLILACLLCGTALLLATLRRPHHPGS